MNEQAQEAKWFEDRDNLGLTASWMAYAGYTADDIAYFVNKPWKFEEEYRNAIAQDGYTSDDFDRPDTV